MKKILPQLLCLALWAPIFPASASEKPNIVYILCDDLGYGDIHCLAPETSRIPTPNADKLASQGMIFTDAHSGSGQSFLPGSVYRDQFAAQRAQLLAVVTGMVDDGVRLAH